MTTRMPRDEPEAAVRMAWAKTRSGSGEVAMPRRSQAARFSSRKPAMRWTLVRPRTGVSWWKGRRAA